MRSCEAKLRYFDWDGQVHIVKGKTGGQQGDPLEILIFNLTVHHIWGRVLAKFQGARAVAYADDGYIKGKLSDVLQVLAELKRVLKEDAGLELNISKTAVLSKAITQQALFDVAHGMCMCHMHSLITPPNLLSLVEGFPLTLFALTALWESVYLLALIILFANLWQRNAGKLLRTSRS